MPVFDVYIREDKKHCETNSVSDIIPERIGIFMPFYFEGLFFLKEKCNKGTFMKL